MHLYLAVNFRVNRFLIFVHSSAITSECIFNIPTISYIVKAIHHTKTILNIFFTFKTPLFRTLHVFCFLKAKTIQLAELPNAIVFISK